MSTLICKLINFSNKSRVSIISMNIRKCLSIFVGLFFILVTNTTFAAPGQGYMSFRTTQITVHPGDAASYMRVVRDWPTSRPYLDMASETPNPAQQQTGATVTTSLVGNVMSFTFSIPDLTPQRRGADTDLTCGDRVIIQIDPLNAASSTLISTNFYRYVAAIRNGLSPSTNVVAANDPEPIVGSFFAKFRSVPASPGVPADWDVVTSSTAATVTGFSASSSTYTFTIDIPLSDLGLTTMPPQGVGLALAIVNDLGWNTSSNASSHAQVTGTAFPLAMGFTLGSEPGLKSCGGHATGNWIRPNTWGQAYTATPTTATVTLDPNPEWVFSRSIKLGTCDKSWDQIGEASRSAWPDQSTILNWYKYDKDGPCRMAVWIKAQAPTLTTGQIANKRFLVLWGRPGIYPQDWYVAGLTAPVSISGTETKFSFIWNKPPVQASMDHPCMRVYVLPDSVTDSSINAYLSDEATTGLKYITDANLRAMEVAYAVPSPGNQTAQMNFSNLSTGTSCSNQQCMPLFGLGRNIQLASLNSVEIPMDSLAVNDITGNMVVADNSTNIAVSAESKAELSKAARVIARGYGVAKPIGNQRYVYIEYIGALGWIFPNNVKTVIDDKTRTTKQVPETRDVSYGVTNPRLAEFLVVNGKGVEIKAPPRKIFVDYTVEVAQGVNKPNLGITKSVSEYMEPGKTIETHLNLSAVDKPVPPPCPCATKCPKSALNDTDAISGSLVLVGSLGIGGFAFLRRKRKQDKNVVDARTED